MAITPNNYSFSGGAFMGGSDSPVTPENIHTLNLKKNGESIGNYNPLVGDATIDIPSDGFECSYDTTTATQIHAARQSGKAPYLYKDGIVVPLWKTETGKFTFRTTSTRAVDGETYLDIVDYVVEGSEWSTESHTVSGSGGGSQQAYLKKVSSLAVFDTTGRTGMQTVAYVNDVPEDGVYQVSVMLYVTPKTASPTKSDLVFGFYGSAGTGMPNTTFHAVVDDSQTFAQQLSFSTTLNLKAGTNSLKLSCGGFATQYFVFVDDLTVAGLVIGDGTVDIVFFDVMWDSDGNDYIFPAAQDVINAVGVHNEVQLVFHSPAGVNYVYSITYKSSLHYEWTRKDCQAKFNLDGAGDPVVWTWTAGDTSLKQTVGSLDTDIGKIGGSIAPAYSSLTFPIAEGTLCMYARRLYTCSAAGGIPVSEDWNSTHWTLTKVSEIVGNVETLLAAL